MIPVSNNHPRVSRITGDIVRTKRRHPMSWSMMCDLLGRSRGGPWGSGGQTMRRLFRARLSDGTVDPLVAKALWRAVHFSGPCRGVTPHKLRNLGHWVANHYRPGSNPGWSF